MDNIQKKISRIRPPRVQITYDLETNGAKILKKLPYIICILADLSGDSEKISPYKARRFINLNGANLHNVMEYLDVRLKILLPIYKSDNPNSKKLVNIALFGVDSFHPDQIVNNIDFLNEGKNTMSLLKDLKRKLITNDNSMNSILNLLQDNNALSQLTDYVILSQSDKTESKVDNNITNSEEKNNQQGA